MSKPNRKPVVRKPRPDFPLFPHQTGRWAKKVRQRLVYFGKLVDDPKGVAALAKWLAEKDDLLAGRTPRATGDGLSVADLCNEFLTSKRCQLDSGELTLRSFGEYHATCARVVAAFGGSRLVSDLDASDFRRFRASMAKGWSPVTLGCEIARVRVVFNHAVKNLLIPSIMRYGSEFNRPSRKTIRTCRADKGPRMFEADTLRKIIDAAGVPLKAMILLAVNCGFGNTDVGSLPMKALELKGGWVDFPRPKTGIQRHCPLWPETVAAIKAAIAKRPKPKAASDAGLVFITKYGQRWGKVTVGEPDAKGKVKVNADDPVCKEFGKLIKALGVHRPGLGFYALRHTFETIGGGSRDQVAVDAIMGHSPRADDMSAVYRERIGDDRLVAVVQHVHDWLFKIEGKK